MSHHATWPIRPRIQGSDTSFKIGAVQRVRNAAITPRVATPRDERSQKTLRINKIDLENNIRIKEKRLKFVHFVKWV